MEKPYIYIAGPDVFLPDPGPITARKKEILADLGLFGCAPLDNSVKDTGGAPADLGREIARLNFAMMDRCDACIAHLTPYHGPSADVGTTGEIHYMYAKGKPVFAYSNDARPFFDRVAEKVYQGRVARSLDTQTGRPTYSGDDGMHLENFGLFDNLMLPYAVADSGGSMHFHIVPPENYYTDLTAFMEAAHAAARHFRASRR